MRILVLSFYYRPDLSAGSFRTTALVAALRDRLPPDSHVDVLTTLPHRYQSFSVEARPVEEQPGLCIRRFALGYDGSGMADQSLAFASFARQVRKAAASKPYDVVFATSSRLMTAVLGAWVAGRAQAKLYLDIRDIFAETIGYILPGPRGAVARRASAMLERYAVRRADKVNLVSPGFVDYFRARYPGQRFSCITNGIDDEFLEAGPAERRSLPRRAGPGTLSVTYAGNIGEGQGLHHILPPLAVRLGTRVHFTVIGDGGRRAALAEAVERADATNVQLQPPVGRKALIEAYGQSDVLFLHLNDFAAFQRVLPSKVFEYGAMGKPMWAGVSGFAEQFVRSEIINAAVFRPCDVADAERSLDGLRLEETPRTAFVAKFGRDSISEQLAQDVLSVAGDLR